MRAGPALMIIGALVFGLGAALRFGLMSWFGNLPGDIRHQGETTTVFVPITSMLVISVVASLILAIVRRLSS